MAGYDTSVAGGQRQEVMRGEALRKTAPEPSPDAREGRAQAADSPVTHSYLCGHVHESRGEAEQCARTLAARLSSRPMPPDYYLG